MDLMTLQVKIEANDNATKTLQNIERQGGRTDKALSSSANSVGSSMDSMGSSASRAEDRMNRMSGGMQAAGGAATALGAVMGGALVVGIKSAVSGFADAERIGAQTEAVLKSTGNAANVTAKDVSNLAAALSKKTATDDEAIQEGQNLLLTFTNIRNEAGKGNAIFDRTTGIMVDMARALGTDASGSAIQLGKALNDPVKGVSALQRVGVSFTEEQKEQIKTLVETNDTLGAQKIILAELERQFGGSGAAYAKTMAGQWDLFKIALGNFGETVGAQLAPAGEKLLSVGNRIINWVTSLSPKTQGLIAVGAGLVTTFVAVAGAALLLAGFLGPLFLSVGGFAGIMAGLSTALATVSGFALPVVAVVAALAAGAIILYRNWDRVKAALAPVGQAFQAFGRYIAFVWKEGDYLNDWLGHLPGPLQGAAQAIGRVISVIKPLGTVIRGLVAGNTGTEQFRRAFASLPGPVQNAVKLIVVAWRGLKTAFSQAWTQIRPILSQIGSGLRTGLVTAFNFALSQGRAFVAWFRSSWPQIRATVVPILTAIGNIIRTVLVGAFRFALSNIRIFVNFFKANWPLIRQTTMTVFNAVRTIVTGAFRTIMAVVRPIIAGLVAFWRQNSTQILTIARTAWNTIKTVIQTAIRVVLGIVKTVMQLINGDWRGAWNTIKQTASVVWNAIKQLVQNGLTILGNIIQIGLNLLKTIFQTVWNAIKTVVITVVAALVAGAIAKWNELRTRSSEAFEAVKQAIATKIEEAKTRAMEIVANLIAEGMSKFESFRDSVGEVFNSVKDRIVSPIEDAYNGVVEWIGKIISEVDRILGLVGLDPIGSGSADNSARSGSPRRRRGRAFANGGVSEGTPLRRFARGGIGTSGRNPRMHLWNEQQGNEAFIAEKRPAKEQLPYLQTAADWHGYAVVPANPSKAVKKLGPHALHKHARGGVEGEDVSNGSFSPVGIPVPVYPVPTLVAAFAGGGIGAMYEAVKAKFGIEGFNNHGSYLSGAAATDSLDFMVTTPGNRAEGSQKELGDNIAAFTAPPSAVNTIWYGQANFGGGWQPYSTGPGVGNANTLGHYDHIHAQAYPDQFRGAQGDFPGGGGGGGIGNWILEKFNGLWSAFEEKFVDPFIDPLMDSSYVLANVAGAAAKMIPDGIKEWIISKLPMGGGGGGEAGPGGGDPTGNRALGEEMLSASGVSGSFSSLDSLWQKESNWDQNATNPSSGAHGIPQALPGSKMGPAANPPENNPRAQIDWGLGYIADRYGSTDAAWQHSQANNWYRDGGLIRREHQAVVHPNELYLPLDNPNVMRTTQEMFGQGALREAIEREIDEIRAMKTELVGKLDRVNLDRPTMEGQIEIIRRGTLGTIQTPEAAPILERVNRTISERTRRMGGRV